MVSELSILYGVVNSWTFRCLIVLRLLMVPGVVIVGLLWSHDSSLYGVVIVGLYGLMTAIPKPQSTHIVYLRSLQGLYLRPFVLSSIISLV